MWVALIWDTWDHSRWSQRQRQSRGSCQGRPCIHCAIILVINVVFGSWFGAWGMGHGAYTRLRPRPLKFGCDGIWTAAKPAMKTPYVNALKDIQAQGLNCKLHRDVGQCQIAVARPTRFTVPSSQIVRAFTYSVCAMWPDYWGLCPPNWQPDRCSRRRRRARRSAAPGIDPTGWCPQRCCAVAPCPTQHWQSGDGCVSWALSLPNIIIIAYIVKPGHLVGLRIRLHYALEVGIIALLNVVRIQRGAHLQQRCGLVCKMQTEFLIVFYHSQDLWVIRNRCRWPTPSTSPTGSFVLKYLTSHLQCTMRRHLSSMELPSMNWFSARHVKYLPSSSRVGVNVSILRDWLSGSLN